MVNDIRPGEGIQGPKLPDEYRPPLSVNEAGAGVTTLTVVGLVEQLVKFPPNTPVMIAGASGALDGREVGVKNAGAAGPGPQIALPGQPEPAAQPTVCYIWPMPDHNAEEERKGTRDANE